ncbi:formate-dependent phosphoribosylglycinamide formyltransferase [Mycobacterium heidelbergense]|uniref:Phosphoribosylglycinamide formyltransferase 2 n=1 Tax=Mycobacterium heidelbergense TaxID=53376 RepID=A0A1X0DMQ2_MYCHE|nr:formate-dependent phosphoribosylglycinamide formyltransferase [Mycobacterium heidelbergense]MCV7049254.1 formate-dependent phosphoribosylglycinamide formyltransferase [Mycobacterium heidelbergense]ORA73684.1 phosphoribosylglycinamide formyltransferase 2 [Mycobacterium heidelbergense]BBZ49767.1 phosphoribosylglycinamide formyltransferase 2 [Mycobacterium heidelbergense]
MTDGLTEGQDDKTTARAVPPQADVRPRVLLLGSDELSRELAVALRHLGAQVIAAGDDRAPRVTDAAELSAAIHRLRPDFVVAATDGLAVDALEAPAAGPELVPSARTARLTADREGLRRLAADELGLPTAPFWFVGSLGELQAVAGHAGFPLLVKPVAGRGHSVVSGPGDIEPAWRRALGGSAGRVLAEALVEVEFDVTLLVVRSEGPHGPLIEFCSPIGHRDADGVVLESWQPQQMSPAAVDAARSIAARIVKALGGRGLFAVELMIKGDEVYFVDVTARPHPSAWVTLRSQRLSAFELQARAILGLPLDTMMMSPGAAHTVNPGHDGGPPAAGALAAALRVPESDLRGLGVALATAPDVATARDRARQVATALNGS